MITDLRRGRVCGNDYRLSAFPESKDGTPSTVFCLEVYLPDIGEFRPGKQLMRAVSTDGGDWSVKASIDRDPKRATGCADVFEIACRLFDAEVRHIRAIRTGEPEREQREPKPRRGDLNDELLEYLASQTLPDADS